MKIGFIGLSHLGLCYLAASAEKGCQVIGYSRDKDLLLSLSEFELSVKEPNLVKTLKKNKKKITFTNDITLLNNADLIFISLDVKTSQQGKSDLRELNLYLENIYANIKKNKLIILLSQVPPGYTDSIKWKKKYLYYQVETLVFGKALERALSPERIIIGKDVNNLKINLILKKYYNLFSKKHFIMSYSSAELTKISINIFLASSITTTNTIAEICEKISADWSDILPALRSDKRIGEYAYLNPGLGIGGGNILRDIKSLKNIAKKNNSSSHLMNSFINNSKRRQLWIINKIKNLQKNKKINKISLLGLSYKEGTNSILNSPAIFLIKYFKEITFYAFDPIVKSNIKHSNLIICKNYSEAILLSKVLVICTPHKEFNRVNLNNFSNIKYLFDPLGFVDINKIKYNLNYFKIGQ